MKTRYTFLAIILFLVPIIAVGQDLKVPNTPAFSILGYEPTSVMRPNSTKKLSSDLLNSFDSEGKLLMNLGLEVAPYWLKSRPGLTREEYLSPKPLQSFLQTFSISAATVKDTITGHNNLGLGFRVQLIKGKLTDEFAAQETALQQLEIAIAAVTGARAFAGNEIRTLNQAIDFIVNNMRENKIPDDKILEIEQRAIGMSKDYKNTEDSIKAFCVALNESFEEETTALAKKVIILSNKRTGFSLEVASAGKFITTTGNQAFQKAGFWVNANNYFTETDAWTITARLMTNTADTTSTNFDAGFGYIKEGENFNVSIDGMLRWYRTEIPDLNQAGEAITRLEKDFTYRLSAQVSYTIVENISVNLSLGKDFDDAHLSGSSFFSILGLQYALFNRQKALLERTP